MVGADCKEWGGEGGAEAEAEAEAEGEGEGKEGSWRDRELVQGHRGGAWPWSLAMEPGAH